MTGQENERDMSAPKMLVDGPAGAGWSAHTAGHLCHVSCAKLVSSTGSGLDPRHQSKDGRSKPTAVAREVTERFAEYLTGCLHLRSYCRNGKTGWGKLHLVLSKSMIYSL
jgi:hypothetical protein